MQSSTPCVLLAEEVWGSGLQAIRSLGRGGVPVHVAVAGQGANIYSRSRFCTEATDISPLDPDTFVTGLLEWCDRLEHPAFRPGPPGTSRTRIPVIPLSDRLVEFLDATRDRFDDRYALSIPSAKITRALLDKAESLRIAERAGLDVPQWFTASDLGDLAQLQDLRPPIAIRPTSWSTAGSDYFKIAVGRDLGAAEQLCSEAVQRGATLIVQEYVEAEEDDVELAITWNHPEQHQPAICTGRKRRQSSPDGGVMVWGEAVDLPDTRAAATAFLAESGFSGLGGIEFIRADERSWFIEFNPRAEAIHFLASRAGMDTLVWEYRALSDGSLPARIPAQRAATAWVGAAWLARLMADPSAWRAAIQDRIAFGRSPARIKAVWTATDPFPSIALTGRLLTRGMNSLMTRRRGAR